MKKRIIALVCAAALAMCLPVLAFASDPSPTNGNSGQASTPTYNSGSSANKGSYSSPRWTDNGDGTKTMTRGYSAGKDLSVFVKTDITVDKNVQATVKNTQQNASNYTPSDKDVAVVSYEITSSNFADSGTTMTLVYTLDEQYSGFICNIYIEHGDGSTEVMTKSVAANGTVDVTIDRLSTFTFVLTNEKATAAAADNKATSPKTGGIL